VEKHRGRVIKTIGDGVMTTFTDSVCSVEAAVEIQKTLAEANALRPEAEHIGVRIGIHYGIGIVRTDDVFGDVVNMASRVESQAATGQILVSDSLYEQIGSKFSFREMGRFLLKGKTSEHTLFQVNWQSVEPPSATPAQAPVATESAEPTPHYRIQEVKRDGSLGPQHPIATQLTIGRTQGVLRFPIDANMAPLNAKLFVQDSQLFIEDLSAGAQKVFVRLIGGHTLQTGDIVIMGQQVFRFHEVPGALVAVTQYGISLHDLHSVLDSPVAELIQINANGKTAKTCPLRSIESQFGRTRGNYMFPEDKMMSRVHARVLQRGEDFMLEDAGSHNGTFVNVRTKTPLLEGSAVLVGSSLFRVLQS
jgi:hypothetical protein